MYQLPKSKYSDPNQRPNLKNPKPSASPMTISTRFSSDNKILQKALGVNSKKKQSQFMKKINKPLIKNQIKEDILDAFMQLID